MGPNKHGPNPDNVVGAIRPPVEDSCRFCRDFGASSNNHYKLLNVSEFKETKIKRYLYQKLKKFLLLRITVHGKIGFKS